MSCLSAQATSGGAPPYGRAELRMATCTVSSCRAASAAPGPALVLDAGLAALLTASVTALGFSVRLAASALCRWVGQDRWREVRPGRSARRDRRREIVRRRTRCRAPSRTRPSRRRTARRSSAAHSLGIEAAGAGVVRVRVPPGASGTRGRTARSGTAARRAAVGSMPRSDRAHGVRPRVRQGAGVLVARRPAAWGTACRRSPPSALRKRSRHAAPIVALLLAGRPGAVP